MRYILYKVGMISCLLLLGSELIAQSVMSTTDIIAQQLGSISLQSTQLEFLANEKQDLPLLRELEFRSETDEWEPGQQEYGFRLNFNGRGMRATQRSITTQRTGYYALKQGELVEDQLLVIYDYLINYHYTQVGRQLSKEEQIILTDRKRVYEKMLTTADLIEIEDLIKADRELQQMERKLLRADQLLANVSQLLAIPVGTELGGNWITFSKMEEVLAKGGSLANFEQTLQEQKILEAQLEQEMEEQEGKQLLNFLSIKQAGRDRLSLGREFSLGFGLNLPLKSNNRTKRNEAILEVLDEEQELADLERKTTERISMHLREFNSVQEEYHLLEQLIKDGGLETMLSRYLQSNEVHPLSLLKIKESILDDRRSLLDLEEKACYHFLEVLYYRGQLSTPTRLNYLSEGLEEISF